WAIISLIKKLKSDAAATSTSPANADPAKARINKAQATKRRIRSVVISAFPGITELRVFEELRIRKAIEKRNQIVLFRICQFEATHIKRLVRIVVANARVRSRNDRPSAGRVMIDHFG